MVRTRAVSRIGLLTSLVVALIAAHADALPVFDPLSGHWYDSIAVSGGINWDDARTAAESSAFGGAQGHLVTITSAAEQSFLETNMPAATFGAPGVFGYWIGGYRPGGSTDFSWVTGETFGPYTNWNGGEPNFDEPPAGIHFFGVGSPLGTWNDATAAIWNFGGYVVEYEGVPLPPSLLLLIAGLVGLARRRTPS